MSLREINRQLEHWRAYPPPVLQLLRIGISLGVPAPEPSSSLPVRPSSEDELIAMARQFGVAVPEARHGG